MGYTETKSETTTKAESKPVTAPNKGNRCLICNKKVGYTGFTCRCGGLFCGAHRSENDNKCTYDFAKAANATLETKLVKINSSRDQLVI